MKVLEDRAAEPADPVFVDRSGWRRRLFTGLGASLGIALIVGCVLLVAGLMGSSPVPLPGLPQGGQGSTPDGEIGVQPSRPTDRSAPPSHTGQLTPPVTTAVAAGGANPATAQPPPSATTAPGNRRTSHPGNPRPSKTK